MSKVIDLVPRLKTVAKNDGMDNQPQTDIVSFEEQKQVLLFKERRQVKRTILTEFMSAMVVLPEKGLLKVSLFDISEDGLSFNTEIEAGRFKVGEEISMRVYLNQKTYFPIQVTVKYANEDITEGVVKHGAEYMKGVESDVALQHFVRFIESVSSGLKKDNGDLMVTRTS
jgi:PilZ domain